MNSPYQAPPSPPDPPIGTPYRGSLIKGFLLGWAVLIGGYVVVATLYAGVAQLGGYYGNGLAALAMLGNLLPWGGLIGLIVWFAVRNEPRSAVGVALTIASLVALAILLVAACFGLFALSGSGWH